MSIQTDTKELKSASKFLAKVLRHQPELLGLELEAGGWVSVAKLLAGLNARNRPTSKEDLDFIVANNDKSRYAYDSSGEKIRANQGHSEPVDLELPPMTPPDILFHGTNQSALDPILAEGLKKMSRNQVHLSTNTTTAETVGRRRGKPIVLKVDAKSMAKLGYLFYRSDNGVWLTDHVPPEFICVVNPSH